MTTHAAPSAAPHPSHGPENPRTNPSQEGPRHNVARQQEHTREQVHGATSPHSPVESPNAPPSTPRNPAWRPVKDYLPTAKDLVHTSLVGASIVLPPAIPVIAGGAVATKGVKALWGKAKAIPPFNWIDAGARAAAHGVSTAVGSAARTVSAPVRVPARVGMNLLRGIGYGGLGALRYVRDSVSSAVNKSFNLTNEQGENMSMLGAAFYGSKAGLKTAWKKCCDAPKGIFESVAAHPIRWAVTAAVASGMVIEAGSIGGAAQLFVHWLQNGGNLAQSVIKTIFRIP